MGVIYHRNLINRQIKYDRRLICNVKIHPAIYDKSHPAYSSISERKRVWDLIAKNLQSSAKMCEERWNQLVEMYKATNFAILHIALYEEMDQFLNKYCESADLSAEDFEEQIDFEELLASGFIDETYASPPSNIHLFSNGFCETEDEEFYSL
ncbi:uncharacterized protein LOC108907847 isoform X3 [Anoplophora glabripennis]|uniref:uncharacterized protein LOC108907847 isoform X3 n=1 Tax=Anoplophora glabripennis TaxID=217634 RepID=UPI0008745BB1|nr:uncharacterized protein LOC108907847 isoform X3 [Anoplophora glabripennis]